MELKYNCTISNYNIKVSPKENGGRGEFQYDILNILQDLCKRPNIPLPDTMIKK
jgi:hypothetical protein